ncbi:MAG: hypothetical protein IPK82_34665 [Polyangiaceae bacterium]|nr:hypothetical protein [Polyangiaceae bacterium]
MWRSRSYWMALLAVAYTTFASIRSGGPTAWLAWLVLVASVGVLGFVWGRTASPNEPPSAASEAAAAARICAAAAAVLIAAKTGADDPLLSALSNAGAMAASIAALWALARLPGKRGILPEDPGARRLDAAAFASLFWTIAVTLPAVRAFAPDRMRDLDPVADDYAAATASIGSMGVTLVSLVRARTGRKLELGAADRTNAALSLTLLALVVGVSVAASGAAAAPQILPITACAAACAVAWAAVTLAPLLLGRVLRVAAIVTFGTTPLAIGAVLLLDRVPERGGAAVLAACAASTAVGLAAALLDARWWRAQRTRAPALASAARATTRTDPDEALEEALRLLARTGPDGVAWLSPAVFRLHPPEMVTVDRAGYGHVEPAILPNGLLAIAENEPDAVLRAEVLRAVAVRRPDVRPMLAWMDERSFDALCVLFEERDPIAVLALPNADRKGPMTVDEVAQIRALADQLAATAAVSAALARSRARELSERERAQAHGAEAERLAGVIEHQAGRLRAVAEMLARPARVAAYSPAARVAIETLERLGDAGKPVTLLVAPGLDPIPWAAVAHLASPRRDGALVFVNAVGNRDLFDVARWRDSAVSPLTAARGGTLVLLDVQALPLDVQRFVAVAAGDDTGIIVASYGTIDALVGQGKLDETLADKLGDRAVALPTLAARAEDLRGLLLDRLARIGERLGGKPLGLAPQALAALTEHPWPGNDAEMEAVLVRAALTADEPVLSAAALRASGFRLGDRTPIPHNVAPTRDARRPKAEHDAWVGRPARGRPGAGKKK